MKNNEDNKVGFSRRMVGKRIWVLAGGGWYGDVVSVKNWETFIVASGNSTKEVNIHDIRSIE